MLSTVKISFRNNLIKTSSQFRFFTSSDLETNFLTDNSKRYIYKSQSEAIKLISAYFINNKHIRFFIRAHPSTALDEIEDQNYNQLIKNGKIVSILILYQR